MEWSSLHITRIGNDDKTIQAWLYLYIYLYPDTDTDLSIYIDTDELEAVASANVACPNGHYIYSWPINRLPGQTLLLWVHE
jgi:hypothetical protein